jgi:SP family facilitated glucose transporter-like MFS transporter 3
MLAKNNQNLSGSADESEKTLWDLIKNHERLKLLMYSMILQMCQQFSGINAVFYYSTQFFEGN